LDAIGVLVQSLQVSERFLTAANHRKSIVNLRFAQSATDEQNIIFPVFDQEDNDLPREHHDRGISGVKPRNLESGELPSGGKKFA
jgi:hypothetical protein